MRAFVLTAFLLGLAGTAAELLLVGHTENFWQSLPLLLMGVSLIPLAVCMIHQRSQARAGRLSLRIFQVIMFLFIASGLLGLFLHHDFKVEFKQESDPSLAGWALFCQAIKSPLPPALAPAAMIQFALLGLAYTYRHPAFCSATRIPNETT